MSNSNSNQINTPHAREAMDRFRMQAAQEVGSVVDQMVKNVFSVRIAKFDRNSRNTEGYIQKVVCVATITI